MKYLFLLVLLCSCEKQFSLNSFKGDNAIVVQKDGEYWNVMGDESYRLEVQDRETIYTVYTTQFDYNKYAVGDTIK